MSQTGTFSDDQDSVFAEDCEHHTGTSLTKAGNSSETHNDIYSRSDSDSDCEEESKLTANRESQTQSRESRVIQAQARNDSATRLYAEEEIKDRYVGPRRQTNFEELERASAHKYVEELVKTLPTMLESYSTLEADELIQRFSSDICTGQEQNYL